MNIECMLWAGRKRLILILYESSQLAACAKAFLAESQVAFVLTWLLRNTAASASDSNSLQLLESLSFDALEQLMDVQEKTVTAITM